MADFTPAGSLRDPGFLRTVRPVLERFASYFRAEVRGFDRLPATGPFLVVGNHSGGQIPPDLPVLLTAWWRRARRPTSPCTHSSTPFCWGSREWVPALKRAGAIEAGPVEAEAVLRGGGILIDYPGGDYEVFRPWRERNRIEFGDRLGVVRLALRTQVPVVPAVSVGAHETLVVLARGERLAKRLRIDRLFRIKVMPLVLGPPFGVVPGGIPTWPLPAKITVELCEPIDWSSRYGPEAADDDAVVRGCYEELVGSDAGRARPVGRGAPLPRHRVVAPLGGLRHLRHGAVQRVGERPRVGDAGGTAKHRHVQGAGVAPCRDVEADALEDRAHRVEGLEDRAARRADVRVARGRSTRRG